MAKKDTITGTAESENTKQAETQEVDNELETLKKEHEALTSALYEQMKKNKELNELLSQQTVQLVVIPYKKTDSQGKELELAIRGWKKHFLEPFQLVVVGDREEFFTEDIFHVPHECNTDNPPLDIVAKLKEVIAVFPDVEDIILTNDDIYPINNFNLTEIKLLKIEGLLSDQRRCGQLYAANRTKTLDALIAANCPIHDYGTHTPVYLNVEQLLELFEEYDMGKEPYLITSLYFNKYFPTHVPLNLSLEGDHIKVGVYRQNANLSRLREFIPRKIFINNSVEGWTPELEKMIKEILQ